MSFYGLSLPTRALLPRITTPGSRPGRANRKRGTSSEISEYISLYTTPSRDDLVPEFRHVENIKPNTENPYRPDRYNDVHHVSEVQELASPSSEFQSQATPVAHKSYKIPLPDMGFVHFDTTPFTSPVVKDDTRSPAASSDYPSEGIRSEECLSPPDDGKLSIRQGEFNLSGLHEYYYSGPRERTSEMRSTSVTDAAGPHIRNTSTSLQDELATANAGPNVFDEGSTTASDADRSSQGSSSRKSSATMIGRTFTGEKLVKIRTWMFTSPAL
ncbi:hypothetical protein BKA67DRAFT_530496 [Truncatella angustata]|uniref:Uncharacterized protein n=1 Tax=Truncatella angustata TaxID=152316 RepID=A0A9P8UXZ5_9PEZI|nr:uncharacterized protein BKA67DRAFT_530496 [Truncatella angustata]KAH6660402.1 hypothetical protein BKA67DRAFT_530496 [Truncatella angustata]